MMSDFKMAKPDHIWVWTEVATRRWHYVCERDGKPEEKERYARTGEAAGRTVPASWVAKGYVREEAV
jgi:hypothetical protein